MACRFYSVFSARDRAVPGRSLGVAPRTVPGTGTAGCIEICSSGRERRLAAGNRVLSTISGRKGMDAGDGDKVFRYQHQV